jgi:hypothetical protein
MVNDHQKFADSSGQLWTQAVGRILAGVTFLLWELEFRQYSFNLISRVSQSRLGIVYHALDRFSLMLCSPHPFRGAFRAMVVVTWMTLLLLMLTNKNFF